MVTKDLPISPRFTPYEFVSRCKFSTFTTRQPMVGYYLLTFTRFIFNLYIYFFLRTSSARGGGGGRCQTFSFSFFPCSADHERDWPPCKVVFFGSATNALNVKTTTTTTTTTLSVTEERTKILLLLVRIEPTTSAPAGVQVTY